MIIVLKDEDGAFHTTDRLTGQERVLMDEHGTFYNIHQPTTGRRKSVRDADGHVVPGAYIEDENEVVEVQLIDEKELDEDGKPKVKMVLRHRGSMGAPPGTFQNEKKYLVVANALSCNLACAPVIIEIECILNRVLTVCYSVIQMPRPWRTVPRSGWKETNK